MPEESEAVGMGQARKSLWIEVLLAQRDVDSGDKRSADEICQQELKSAVR